VMIGTRHNTSPTFTIACCIIVLKIPALTYDLRALYQLKFCAKGKDTRRNKIFLDKIAEIRFKWHIHLEC